MTTVQWIAIAEHFVQEQIPSDPKRVKWIARLKRELVAHPMQEDCTVDCRSKYRHLWLVANAAQYLAGRFSGGVKIKPPYVAPPDGIVKQLADWLGNKITEGVQTNLGWWVSGGVVVGLGVLGLIKLGGKRRPVRR